MHVLYKSHYFRGKFSHSKSDKTPLRLYLILNYQLVCPTQNLDNLYKSPNVLCEHQQSELCLADLHICEMLTKASRRHRLK